MKKSVFCVAFLSLMVVCPARGAREMLWPPIEPYDSGFLQVSAIHKIRYELCGSRTGKPVFVLHGGPGGSCSPYMRRFFDPDKFLIVLHDQRGAGKSTPFAEIEENTTQHLVADIERLRTHLDLDKIVLFGGSWGSTLALAYAEKYPGRVTDMVLRGIFTGTDEEIDQLMLFLDAEGKPPEAFSEALEARKRRMAGDTAPAKGLTLHRVIYDE